MGTGYKLRCLPTQAKSITDLIVGIDNNTKEEKRRNHKHQKLHEKPKSKKSPSHTKIHYLSKRWEKKRILTAALYNGTHNSIIY